MIDRTKIPVPTGNVSFEIPQIKHFISPKGDDVYFIGKNKLPIVNFSILFNCGSKFDSIENKGLALLTSFMIDEGAGKYDTFQISNEFEKLGTIFNINVNHDSFLFSILTLRENFERSLELLSMIINQPRFDEKDFHREKKKLIDKILQLKDEPGFIASVAFDKQIFKDCYYAYPSIGYEHTVININIDDVKNYYHKYIKKSKRKFIVTGNTSEEEISKLIDKYFDVTEPSFENIIFELQQDTSTRYFIVHKENSAQGEIRIGHLSKKRNSPDYFAKKIMNSILGGEFFSRINLNLREHKGFTYGAHSAFYYHQNAGYFEVSTSVNINNVAEAVHEILIELEKIKTHISDEEIKLAKSFSIKHFPANFETYTQLAQSIILLLNHNLPLNYYNEYIKNIESVDKVDVINAAKENIHPEKLTILVVGDKNKILPQFKNNLIELDI